MVAKSTVLRNLAKRPHIVLNPEDAEELGLEQGDNAVVEGGGMTGMLPVTVDDIARGAVYVPYDQRDFRANVLIRGADPTVKVRQP
jgi:anaerobic selenocysteine-containing dehydrogenase